MCGCHESGWYIIKKLLEEGLKIHQFISLTEEQGKKYQVSGYKSFSDLAEKYDIPIYFPETYSMKNQSDQEVFISNKFDLLIQGGWQRLFPQEILNAITIGGIGFHGSQNFLPKGRGRSPLNWSIIKGHKRFINQAFLMKAGADNGDIIDYSMFEINDFDTIATLYYKMSLTVHRLLSNIIIQAEKDDLVYYPQQGIPTYYNKRTPEDGEIRWDEWDFFQIHNFIRALTKPYPGAFTYIDNKRVNIWDAQIFDTIITYPESKYGEIVDVFEGNLIVNCLGGLLMIKNFNADFIVKNKDVFES